MSVWALADLHLSFGVPDKKMDVFGENWVNHAEKIRHHWLEKVQDQDLVLIPGDISWATHLEDASIDLQWIHALPGTKLLLKGNHDYWWSSLSKVEKILPSSIHVIQNNTFNWNHITIGGARLWDTHEFSFESFIQYKENPRAKTLHKQEEDPKETEKIYQRELLRLESSLKALSKQASLKIAMTHYPPIGADLQPSRASQLLEKYEIDFCLFGHLHNVKQELPMFGNKNGIEYKLVSCDYLNFDLLQIH